MWDGMDPATIKVPTLIYVGGDDPVLPLAQEAARRIPNAKIRVLPGLGHIPANMSGEAPPMVFSFLREQGIVD